MARKRLYEYSFTPGTAGLGTVKVPNRYNLADILAIYDTTTNTAIYNFADNTLGGSVTWAAGVTATFPSAYAGVTTITLNYNTSGLLSSDKLAIYVEDRDLQVQPWDFGMVINFASIWPLSSQSRTLVALSSARWASLINPFSIFS